MASWHSFPEWVWLQMYYLTNQKHEPCKYFNKIGSMLDTNLDSAQGKRKITIYNENI